MAQQANMFKVDPNNYLGFQHEDWRNRLYGLALSHPDQYMDCRNVALTAIRNDACSKFYETLYRALTTGKTLDGIDIHKDFKPCLEMNKANQMAINASATVRDICDEAFEKIMPSNFKDLAHKRLADGASSAGL